MFSLFRYIWRNKYGRVVVKAWFYLTVLSIIFQLAQMVIKTVAG